MRIPPPYRVTPEILELLAKIEANRFVLSSQDISYSGKEKIQRVSLLKSSLFSARIEGNLLTLEEVGETKGQKAQVEIFNLLRAVRFIEKMVKPGKKIDEKFVLELHRMVFNNLKESGGFFRKEAGAIFNQAGVAIYVSPPQSQIPTLLKKLLLFINSEQEKFPLVSAFIAHLVFEKIHPFLDGNGRVGRLLVFAALKARGYNFGLHVPFEEYLDEKKNNYYYYLDGGLKETNNYLSFMLEAFWEETERIKKMVLETKDQKDERFLPPRQEEIYQIIKDHPLAPFDIIRRRFLKVPARTLRYDLKRLLNRELIIKTGRTKGSYYKIANNRRDKIG